MTRVLSDIQTPYIDAQTLINLLPGYQKPRERILRLIHNGDLIRLKNGIYVITDKIKKGSQTLIPFEQIANFLYGPSYVSLEWALSFYGMIPEKVYTVTSAALGKSKFFHTPIGDFSYFPLPERSYSIGITKMSAVDFIGGFLIACPEKALADLVYKYYKGTAKDQLKTELLESNRLDLDSLLKLDKKMLNQIAMLSKSKSVRYLSEIIGTL